MIQKKTMINFKLNIYVYAHHILKHTNYICFFLINVCWYFRVFIQVWITSWERNFILYFLEFRWVFFMLVFDLKSGLFKFCVVVWFVNQWYFSVPYMYFCQGDSHWIPFFLLQAAKGLVPDKVVSRTMCKREYHCLLKGEIEQSSPPSLPLPLPHLIMCLDDAKSNWMQKDSSWA